MQTVTIDLIGGAQVTADLEDVEAEGFVRRLKQGTQTVLSLAEGDYVPLTSVTRVRVVGKACEETAPVVEPVVEPAPVVETPEVSEPAPAERYSAPETSAPMRSWERGRK